MARICATCHEPWPSDCICPDDEPGEDSSDGDGDDAA